MKHCIYCNQEKEDSEFSLEHVIPEAIGGVFSPVNPFTTGDVCELCNNTCGLFVDTAFIKNWFTNVARAVEAMRYMRLDNNSNLPLIYMGKARDIEHEDRICDIWVGPQGDGIFHFHKPYPELRDMPAIVGVAPNLRNRADPGFAFLYIVPSNPVWWTPIARSFARQFRGSQLYLGNGATPGEPFSAVPPELLQLKMLLDRKAREERHVQMQHSINYGVRFLAKLALGLGHVFLHPAFSTSPDADMLRRLLWERDSEMRGQIPVHGTDFSQCQPTATTETLSWPGGHVVALLPAGDGIDLYVRFYERQQAMIRITDQRLHWEGIIDPDGAVFAITPGLRRFVGPKTLPAFLAHRQGVNPDSELQALAEEMQNVPPLPVRHLDESR